MTLINSEQIPLLQPKHQNFHDLHDDDIVLVNSNVVEAILQNSLQKMENKIYHKLHEDTENQKKLLKRINNLEKSMIIEFEEIKKIIKNGFNDNTKKITKQTKDIKYSLRRRRRG